VFYRVGFLAFPMLPDTGTCLKQGTTRDGSVPMSESRPTIAQEIAEAMIAFRQQTTKRPVTPKEKIRRITGAEVREAVAEIEPRTGGRRSGIHEQRYGAGVPPRPERARGHLERAHAQRPFE